jgi:hypothetical protein
MKKLLGYFAVFALLFGTVATTSNAATQGTTMPTTETACTNYGSGCWGGPTSSYIQDPGWTNPSLDWGIVGDSMVYRCASQIRSAFAAEGISSVAIRAWAGANTDNQLDWYQSITYKPNRTLFMLGTNDVFNPFVMPAQLTRAKSLAAAGGSVVFWGDTYVGRPTTATHDLRNSGLVNNYIHSAIPDTHVVDWVANLTGAVGRGVSLNNYIDPDGVHTTPAGCGYLAETIMVTVRPYL